MLSNDSCAFFEVNEPSIVSTLGKTQTVVDGQYGDKANLENMVTDGGRGAYMHNKFCVGNGWVLTGSTNPTVNDITKNDNVIFVVESPLLAENYRSEFDELWGGTFGKGEKVPHRRVYINGKLIENYFCPEDSCEDHVSDTLEHAQKSIYFMTFSFTSDRLGKVLSEKVKNGVEVRGVFEKRQDSRYSEFDTLNEAGADVVYDHNPATMHLKMFIVDNETVVLGSYNPSANANERNDENILIVHDAAIAAQAMKKFESAYQEG